MKTKAKRKEIMRTKSRHSMSNGESILFSFMI